MSSLWQDRLYKGGGVEMKKGTLVFLISLATILIVSPVFSQTTKPIKIGGTLPLTGIYSETAQWVKEGYLFWEEDINKRGGLLGRPVKLIIYDDESNPDKAATYYERVITADNAELIFGGYPAMSNAAVMPLVEKHRKVFVGMGGHMKSFEQNYTFSIASPPIMGDWDAIGFVGVLDDLISKGQWPKTMAILTMNNVGGLSARGPLVKAAEERGIKVVVDETYNLPLTDATPLVSKAKGRGAELLYCCSFFDDGVMITRAAKAMNYNPKLLFQLIASNIPAWMKELGNDGNNVVSTMWWNPRLPFPGNDKINAAAKARYKLPAAPTYFGYGYCWVRTLELAVQGAGTLDDKKISDYLRSHKFDLPYGTGITFDKKGLPPPYGFDTYTTGGDVELIWPKNVATAKLVYPRPQWSK